MLGAKHDLQAFARSSGVVDAGRKDGTWTSCGEWTKPWRIPRG
jgi:hypothetical protein